MLNQYAKEAREVDARIEELYTRKVRFENHPTLYTRVGGVVAEINELMPVSKTLWETAKWSDEIYGKRG